MTVTVSYTCPHCNAVTRLERRPDLADKSVTTIPQPGWEYAEPGNDDLEAADGVAFRCGEDGPTTDLEGEPVEGCGRPFYLNFVRFERGVELEPDPPTYGGPRFDFRP
ncbi:hypothetical protein [Natronobeatus ordinarius]|uniref:hypothetical protein n=1 Tax=Natronobeatus ordinarius TaxID=2963433 RepID=UPI0020CE2ECA|nr:hypothetical protein [Natronobeatus ordinarius]